MRDRSEFLDQAHEILGDKGLSTQPEDLDPWLTDWRGRYTGKAIALASPATSDAVSALARLCSDHGVAIVPQGGNSGMSGGATPDESGNAILLSLRRMNEIGEVDRDGGQVTCGAGAILQNLHEAADRAGLRFPLTLGGKGSATIGGLISTNAGGTQVLRHGTMRDQVLGVEAVLANGDIFNSLTPLKKDNRGFDLKQLLIGSEGTLGIITAATLRLLPNIADRRVLWVGVESIRHARKLLLHTERMTADALEGFEIIPSHCLQSVLDYLPDARAPLGGSHAWHVLIELVAGETAADELPDLAERVLTGAMDAGLIEDATIAASESQADAFWLLRDSISPAERALGPAMQHDISVPVARMPDFIDHAIPAVEERHPQSRAVAFGHLGDGNVHFHVLASKDAVAGEWEEQEGKAISAFVHDLVTEWGGSISAEHGIGQMKRDELGRLGDPVALSVMRSIKDALDPQSILNPGKLVPLAPEPPSA